MRTTTSIEPTIAEMLDDPIVLLLMEHDGVTVEELRQLLADTWRRLKVGRDPSKARSLAASPPASRGDGHRLAEGLGCRYRGSFAPQDRRAERKGLEGRSIGTATFPPGR